MADKVGLEPTVGFLLTINSRPPATNSATYQLKLPIYVNTENLLKSGAENRTRTYNLPLTRRLHYQLCYFGISG